MDVQGPEVVRPYVRQFGVTFPVAVDTADVFGMTFGLKVIPVTYLVDEVGIIRLQASGPSPTLLKQIEELLSEPLSSIRSWQPQLPSALPGSELQRMLAKHPNDVRARLEIARLLAAQGNLAAAQGELEAATKLKPDDPEIPLTWATLLLQHGQRDTALTKLKQARDLDPDNWRIRKQIWALEHPDKFYNGPSPDYGWQKEQLAREQPAPK